MPLHRAFATAVRKIRQEKNLRQIEVANAAQMSVSTYIKIEHGVHVPMNDTINSLCMGLGIATSELFYEVADKLHIQEFQEVVENEEGE